MTLIKLCNVATGRYLDLHNGDGTNGNKINSTNHSDDYTPLGPQMWKLNCHDHARQYYTLKNAQSGTYASAPRVTEGGNFVSNVAEQTLEVLEVAEGIIKMKPRKSDLVISDGVGNEQHGSIKLRQMREGDRNQEWAIVRFHEGTQINHFPQNVAAAGTANLVTELRSSEVILCELPKTRIPELTVRKLVMSEVPEIPAPELTVSEVTVPEPIVPEPTLTDLTLEGE